MARPPVVAQIRPEQILLVAVLGVGLGHRPLVIAAQELADELLLGQFPDAVLRVVAELLVGFAGVHHDHPPLVQHACDRR